MIYDPVHRFANNNNDELDSINSIEKTISTFKMVFKHICYVNLIIHNFIVCQVENHPGKRGVLLLN